MHARQVIDEYRDAIARVQPQLPRRPDFDDVDGGLIRGATTGRIGCCLSSVIFVNGLLLAGFLEKSGMPRGDFFFMRT
jgi:hypothetical protein